MEEYSYPELIADLIANTEFQEEHIYDYSDSENAEEYENTFQFYQNSLVNNHKYGIDPAIFFFFDSAIINAFAYPGNERYVICLFQGLQGDLINNFQLNEGLLIDKDLEEFIAFEERLDNPIHELMYQIVVEFIFSHELGHLIQNSEPKDIMYYEKPNEEAEFNIEDHILEIDADRFGSLAVASTIFDYSKRIFGENCGDEEYELLIVIASSSILLFYLSFIENRSEIYFDQESHPHPIIRTMIVIFTIYGHFIEILNGMGIQSNLAPATLAGRTFTYSEKLSDSLFGKFPVKDFWSILEKFPLEINDYIQKHYKLAEERADLAVSKRNQMSLSDRGKDEDEKAENDQSE